jgi:hypothetical protein
MTKNKKQDKVNIIAKRDFLIVQNNERFEIKEGDDIEALKIPLRFYDNLKTEKII